MRTAEDTTPRVRSSAWLVAAFALGLAGCASSDEVAVMEPVMMGPAAVVSMNEAAFLPSSVTVRVGDTVEWRNDTYNTQSVTADPGLAASRANVSLPNGAPSFHSGDLNRGQTFSHTFTVAGIYRYVSLPRESAGMTGTVIVTQ